MEMLFMTPGLVGRRPPAIREWPRLSENNDCHAEARCRVLTRAGIETWHCCVERHPADLDQASDLGFSSPITRRNFSGSADGTPLLPRALRATRRIRRTWVAWSSHQSPDSKKCL